MKQHTTNNAFFELFKQEDCTQIEMGHRIESDKHSVHDWLKHKTQMKFSSLEAVAGKLGKKIKIVWEN